MIPAALRFSRWAQPVTSRRWALIAVLAEYASRLSGYRLLASAKHRAWERACGILPAGTNDQPIAT